MSSEWHNLKGKKQDLLKKKEEIDTESCNLIVFGLLKGSAWVSNNKTKTAANKMSFTKAINS